MRLAARAWLAALFAAAGALAQRPLAGSRPNIVFVLSDDHAAHAIGAYGSAVAKTPNLDRLAASGVLFRAAFCGNAICGPSRASILTGLHSHANGFCRNGNVFDGDQPTLPKLLQAAGYQTAIVGKWHLESQPTGFDHWTVLPDQGQYYNPVFLTQSGRVRRAGHVTDVVTELALQWLAQVDTKRPFLLLCHHKAPHRNWLPAPADLALFRDGDLPEPPTLFDRHEGRIAARTQTEMEIARHLSLQHDLAAAPADMDDAQRAAWEAAFAAEDAAFRRADPKGDARVRWHFQRYLKNYLRCVHGVDRSIGALLAWLDARPEVKANTLFVYSSDQGFFLGEHGYYDKRWMDDECLRMPLLMQWPGHIAAGGEIAQLVQNIDFAPTLLELAGVAAPAVMHGRSFAPLLEGRDVPWRDAIYYHYYESQATHRVPAMYGVRTQRHKLVRYYEPHVDAWELFDLQADPDERRNVAEVAEYSAVRASLLQRLGELREQYGDDTGDLADGAFTRVAGIARIARENDGFRVWVNARDGFLLRPCDHRGPMTFTTTLRPLAARPQRNGFVVIAGGDDGSQFVRAGVDLDARELVISGPDRMRRATAIEPDRAQAVDLRVDVDIDVAARTVVASAGGARVEAPLPAEWTRVVAAGFGGSNTEAWFADLGVKERDPK